MPESKGRAKPKNTPPQAKSKATMPNPVWFVPVMLGLMLLGLIWVVTFYVAAPSSFPIPGIDSWNLIIGFGLMVTGFMMTTRWR
ncbi:MAG: hypothetical protein QOE58_311 [Actinomycetota bacterium]|nr:hypothetical protein [Actinomycetota bacterium]